MASSVETRMSQLIEKMSNGRIDQIAEVQAMSKTLKMATLKKNFKEHPAMNLFISTMQKWDNAYTLLLNNKRDLDEKTRLAFFEKRDLLRLILGFFKVESIIESLDRELEYQLGDEVSTNGEI